MLVGLVDGFGVIGPSWCERRVACLVENCRPAVPAVWQQPQAVNENDGCSSAGVRLIDLIGGNTRYGVDHGISLLFTHGQRRVGNPSYAVDWAHAGDEADGVV